MNLIQKTCHRLRLLWQRRKVKREIDEELRFHIERRTAENIEAGMAPQEAAREARKSFGNVQSVREECRDARSASFGEATFQDVRFGLRMLRKNPAFTATAVVTLALAIGATTSIFYWINALIFRPLQYPDSNQLVLLSEVWSAKGWGRSGVSVGSFSYWQDQAKSFTAIAACEETTLRMDTDSGRTIVHGAQASSGLFTVLKTHPELGRDFLPSDNQAGGNRVVILSHTLWNQQFGGKPDIVGTPLKIDGRTRTVIGVMPKGFRFPGDTQLWLPLELSADVMASGNHRTLTVIGRLHPDVSIRQARAELAGISARVARSFPDSNQGWGSSVEPLNVLFVGNDLREKFAVMLGAAFLLLLAACANVANLLMARFEKRRRELAIRSSLGAGRGRIIRQMLTESFLLSTLGTVAGLLLAGWLSGTLGALIGGSMPEAIGRVFDGRVLAFAIGLSVFAGLCFGVLPAWLFAGIHPNTVLRQSTGGLVAAMKSRRWSRLWIVSEVACAVTLLAGAGLMILTLAQLTRTELGFDPAPLLFAETNPVWNRDEPDLSPKKVLYFQQLQEAVARVPGLSQAAIYRDDGHLDCVPEGQTQAFKIYGGDCSANLFHALGVPLVRGRMFPEEWHHGDPVAVVVNETFARRCWPGQSAVGKRFRPDSPGAGWVTVVGVVRDFRLGRDREIYPRFYASYRQAYLDGVQLILRSAESPAELVSIVRNAIKEFDPDQTNPEVRTMTDLMAEVLRPRYQLLALLGAIAGVAFLLAAGGIYGVVSCSVAQKRREIGIRIALGALPKDVTRLVLREGLEPVLIGIGFGVLGSFCLMHFLASRFFGLHQMSAGVLAISAILMLGTASLACLVPARTAANADPMEALRCE